MNTIAAMHDRSDTVRGAPPRAWEGGGGSRGWMRCHIRSGSSRSAKVVMSPGSSQPLGAHSSDDGGRNTTHMVAAGCQDVRMGDRLEFLDRYERLGVHLPALRRAYVLASDLTVWTLQPATEPLASWRRLRRVHDRTGLWPFLAGSQLVERLRQDAITDHDPTAVRRGLAMDAGAWLAERATLAGAPDPASVQVDPIALARAAAAEPQVAFTSRDTVIGLIQARHGWEVPGLLSWNGAVNADVDAAHHVAVLHHWQQRYGAELVTLATDQIELLVPRPPQNPVTVAQVAIELLGYCPDLAIQDADAVDSLAAEVVPRRTWSFWWD